MRCKNAGSFNNKLVTRQCVRFHIFRFCDQSSIVSVFHRLTLSSIDVSKSYRRCPAAFITSALSNVQSLMPSLHPTQRMQQTQRKNRLRFCPCVLAAASLASAASTKYARALRYARCVGWRPCFSGREIKRTSREIHVRINARLRV